MIYDITRTISTALQVWPGDSPFAAEAIARIKDGASVNLYTYTMSAHTGTHADAYYHFDDSGDQPLQMPLDAYVGLARVVTVDLQDGPLFPKHFAHVDLAGGERLLIHSHVSHLPDDVWPEKIPYLSEELIGVLADLNYRLIGLDSPSVDPFDSKTLTAHHALKRRGIVNLEHLNLSAVPDGDYELIALPLKIATGCGSPVRAILRTLS